MNTLNDQIVQILETYPSQTQTRGNVLAHLFLVNDTGYLWVDGVLKSAYTDADHALSVEDRYKPLAEQQINHFRGIASFNAEVAEQLDALEAAVWETVQDRVEFDKELIAQAPLIATTPSRMEFHPATADLENSPIFNVPADVHPDFVAGIKETLTLLDDYDLAEYEGEFTDEQMAAFNDKIATLKAHYLA